MYKFLTIRSSWPSHFGDSSVAWQLQVLVKKWCTWFHVKFLHSSSLLILKTGTRMFFIWLEFRPWIPSSPFLSSMRVCLITFTWKWQSRQLYIYIGTDWGIESVIASALSKDLKQSLFLGLQTVWVLLYDLFELLFVIGLTLYGPIVRFRLPSYSVVSLWIRRIRCEWRTTKRISYWASCSTSSSALATMAISSLALIQKS